MSHYYGNSVIVNFLMRWPIATPVVVATGIGLSMAAKSPEPVKPPAATPPTAVVVKPVRPSTPASAPILPKKKDPHG